MPIFVAPPSKDLILFEYLSFILAIAYSTLLAWTKTGNIHIIMKLRRMTLFMQVILYTHHKVTHLIFRIRYQEKSIFGQFSELQGVLLQTHTPLTKVDELLNFCLPFLRKKELIKEIPSKHLTIYKTHSQGPIVSPLGIPCLSYILELIEG